MVGKVLNIKIYSPLKLRIDMIENYHAICHYSYNLLLPANKKMEHYIHHIKHIFIDVNS